MLESAHHNTAVTHHSTAVTQHNRYTAQPIHSTPQPLQSTAQPLHSAETHRHTPHLSRHVTSRHLLLLSGLGVGLHELEGLLAHGVLQACPQHGVALQLLHEVVRGPLCSAAHVQPLHSIVQPLHSTVIVQHSRYSITQYGREERVYIIQRGTHTYNTVQHITYQNKRYTAQHSVAQHSTHLPP